MRFISVPLQFLTAAIASIVCNSAFKPHVVLEAPKCRWLCYQGHYNRNFRFLLSSNNNKAIYQLMLCSGTILCRKTVERFQRPISAVSQLCLVINTVIGINT